MTGIPLPRWVGWGGVGVAECGGAGRAGGPTKVEYVRICLLLRHRSVTLSMLCAAKGTPLNPRASRYNPIRADETPGSGPLAPSPQGV
jgi:hypothetical protein